MSPSIERMRAEVAEAYPNWTWRWKVDNMPDIQVYAVYHSLLESGKLSKKGSEPLVETFHQITLEEWLNAKT